MTVIATPLSNVGSTLFTKMCVRRPSDTRAFSILYPTHSTESQRNWNRKHDVEDWDLWKNTSSWIYHKFCHFNTGSSRTRMIMESWVIIEAFNKGETIQCLSNSAWNVFLTPLLMMSNLKIPNCKKNAMAYSSRAKWISTTWSCIDLSLVCQWDGQAGKPLTCYYGESKQIVTIPIDHT